MLKQRIEMVIFFQVYKKLLEKRTQYLFPTTLANRTRNNGFKLQHKRQSHTAGSITVMRVVKGWNRLLKDFWSLSAEVL